MQKGWFQKDFSVGYVFKKYFCHYKKMCLWWYLSYTPIILLYIIWTNKVVTYLSFVAYVWVIRRLCVWDKMEELFRYLSYLIKIKKNIGVGFRRGCFCHRWCFFKAFFGVKKSLSFLIFFSLFRSYGSQRYISLVSPYHVLLLCISYSHLFIQSIHLFCKTSEGPLTNVYLKLN